MTAQELLEYLGARHVHSPDAFEPLGCSLCGRESDFHVFANDLNGSYFVCPPCFSKIATWTIRSEPKGE